MTGPLHGFWARPRAVLRRLLRRPPSDWAGPDAAREAIRDASPIELDNRHEVVWLGSAPEEVEAALRGLAAKGYRVFHVVAPDPAAAALAIRERAPRLFEVSLSEPDASALDRLRRDSGLGATAVVVGDRAWLGAAQRLRAEAGWSVLDLTETAGSTKGETDLALALARTFQKVSIVIVTYNNRELNRLCLESLFARTEWPNVEVLVVDNGSSDGTPELLAELAARRHELRVIAWPENRGYPAACNAGLSLATGEVLVLLNNDTVLTRGWLAALLRHLARNPRLGLVGPVTNAIANEAKVAVEYSDLDALPAWAAEWVRLHDGETFAISMLAFFCVAMRRSAYASVGPLDEQFGLGLFEDGDYNRRAREKGWEILCARDSFVHHWQNASFRRLGREAYFALYEENREKFEAKWREPLEFPPPFP